MNDLGFQLGEYARSFATEMDKNHIAAAELKVKISTLEARPARKLNKLAAEEANELEGVVYAASMF